MDTVYSQRKYHFNSQVHWNKTIIYHSHFPNIEHFDIYHLVLWSKCFAFFFFFQGYFLSGWISWRHTDYTGKLQGREQKSQPGLLGKIRQGSCRARLNTCCHSTALLNTHWPVANVTSVHVRRQWRYMDVLLPFLTSVLWLNTKRAKISLSALQYCQEKF